MSTIRFPELLSVESWERTLGLIGPLNSDGTWSDGALYEGIHLDFSAVEFAYLGALARALLLLDAAVRDGIRATVVLPNGTYGTAASDSVGDDDAAGSFERHMARKARARADALSFMTDVGFTKALHPAHWPSGAVEVTDAEGAHDDLTEPVNHYDHEFDQVYRLEGDEFRPRRIVPFRWVSRHDDVVEQMLTNTSRRLLDMGLSAADSRAVTHALITELIDNVEKHAETERRDVPRALVAGVLVGDWLYVSRRTQLRAAADPLIALLQQGTGRYVLDIVVGDSGCGLVRSIHGGATTPETANATVLSTFDGTLTTVDGHRREANGLWRVAHLVRGYRGMLQVATAGVIAGKAYSSPDAPEVLSHLPVTAPGTLVEVTLPIEETASHVGSAEWLGKPGGARLDVLSCRFDLVKGIGDADQTSIAEAVRAEGTQGVVITIPVRSTGVWLPDGAMDSALTRVLDVVEESARFVAVIFPDADPQIVDLSVAGVNATGARRGSPLLVLGAAGRPHWCGATPEIRAALDVLTVAGGVLRTNELLPRDLIAEDRENRLRTLSTAHGHLVAVGSDETRLRVSAADVVRGARRWAAERLTTPLRDGGPGVRLGHFRTPTLRRTSRWITMEPLVRKTIGTELAAWLLARQVEQCATLPPRSEQPMVVARLPLTIQGISQQLSECLSIGGRYYEMPGELDLEGIQASDQVPHRANVVLCTDSISTENSLRRAAAAVTSKSAVPAAIVCVLDSRDERKPIRMFNRDVPVFSLVEFDISAGDEPADPVDIDPLLLEPVRPVPFTGGRTPIDEETMLDWCAREVDALRLGHVERMPGTRHFSAYLQFTGWFKQPVIASQLRAVVQHTIDEVGGWWRQEPADPFDECQIWFPGPVDDLAGRFAEFVQDVLAANGREAGVLRSVPRAVAGTRWTFPVSLDVRPPPGTVIVVDWGALSSISVNQMIRLAAESGASAILVLVLLNQLDDQDADALYAINEVRTREPGGQGRVVPTQVRFLVTSRLGGVAAQNCSLCDLRRRAEFFAEHAPAPLREHARQLHERTRVRSREQVFSSPTVDVFNVPVNGTDLADYLRWRGLFTRALRVTAARQEVMERLRKLVSRDAAGFDGQRWTRKNLLRLAAAEEQWLKLPPLRYEEARELLAQICTVVLKQPPIATPWLRAQAVMVMAASKPGQLVRLLPSLVTRTVDEPVMINHLLLECYRILGRPALDSPVDLERMRVYLQRCRNRLEGLLGDRDSAAVRKYLRVVTQMVALVDTQTKRKASTAQEAWHLLREDYQRYVETHSMEATVLRVRDFVEDLLERPAPPHRIGEALADWERCMTQLTERAMVSLSALTDVLAGDYVSDRFGSQDQRKVLAVAEGSGVQQLQEVLDLLQYLEEQPWDPKNGEWRARHADLLDRLRWWHGMFMAPHVSGATAAPVVELVKSVPAEPAKSVARILLPKHPSLTVVNQRVGAAHRVFCPSPLLDNVLEHVLDNLVRHATGDQDVAIEVEYGVRDQKFDLVVRNSGTRQRHPAGQGMRALNEKLRPFGGSLRGLAGDGGDWTFTTKATFPLWQGA